MQTVMQGLRVAEEIAAQPALAPYTSRPCDEPASDSEADLRAYIRRHTYTFVSSRRHVSDGLRR